MIDFILMHNAVSEHKPYELNAGVDNYYVRTLTSASQTLWDETLTESHLNATIKLLDSVILVMPFGCTMRTTSTRACLKLYLKKQNGRTMYRKKRCRTYGKEMYGTCGFTNT